MIKLKEGGLVDRIVSVYGRCPPSSKGNLCTVFWRLVLGILGIAVICWLPTILVLFDLHVYYVKFVGVESSLFEWTNSVSKYPVLLTLAASLFLAGIAISISVQFLIAGTFIMYLLYLIWKWFFVVKGKLNINPIPELKTPAALSRFCSNTHSIYFSIKDKYCPTIEWIKKGDK